MDCGLIVCGARDWEDSALVVLRLDEFHLANPNTVLVHGAARGADRIAASWATEREVEAVRFPARWREHDPDWCAGGWCRSRHYCVGAGPRRNQQMLEFLLHRFDQRCVLAFKDGFDWTFSKGGTEDMVKRAQGAHVDGKVISHGVVDQGRTEADPRVGQGSRSEGSRDAGAARAG